MRFKNKPRTSFLESIPKVCLDSETNVLTEKCKFNFGYFCKQNCAGQSFEDWTGNQLAKLLNKLTQYCNESLSYWKVESIGKGSGHVLEVYGKFPKKSNFTVPAHIPLQAQWARFRLESDARLVGFVIPDKYDKQEQNGSGYNFCTNTFYVVFLDSEHKFYIS